MKQSDVKIGVTYQVKVASNLVPVKIVRTHDSGGWEGTSVKTGKTIRMKTVQRLRRQLADAPRPTKEPAKATIDAKAETKRDTGERGEKGAKRETKPMSLLDAAAHLLPLGTGDPMRCKDIVDLAVERGLWTPGNGRTPATTLYASILREIKTKGEAAGSSRPSAASSGWRSPLHDAGACPRLSPHPQHSAGVFSGDNIYRTCPSPGIGSGCSRRSYGLLTRRADGTMLRLAWR